MKAGSPKHFGTCIHAWHLCNVLGSVCIADFRPANFPCTEDWSKYLQTGRGAHHKSSGADGPRKIDEIAASIST